MQTIIIWLRMIPMKMDEDEADIGDHFTMNESCWDAVKTAVANKIALKREANIKELELPSEESAGIIQGHTIDLQVRQQTQVLTLFWTH